MTDHTAALLPCPFCGHTEIFVEPDERGSGGQWVSPVHVGCNGCKAEQMHDDMEGAVAAWNTRAQPQQQAGWMSIDTAPKDGSYVLLRGKGDHRIADGYWLQAAYNGNGAWVWPYVHSEPVTWMPIPTAHPSQQEDDERDAARLDWLEAQINRNGAIHLHDGSKLYGMGLGLRPGSVVRTLRAAIDTAMNGAEEGGKNG